MFCLLFEMFHHPLYVWCKYWKASHSLQKYALSINIFCARPWGDKGTLIILLRNSFLLIPDYLWWSNCVYRVVVWRWQISSWLWWAISLHQELGKLTHPWPAPGCRRHHHRHCRPSLGCHPMSIETQDNTQILDVYSSTNLRKNLKDGKGLGCNQS